MVRRPRLQGSGWFCVFLLLVGVMITIYALTLRPLQAGLLGVVCGPLLVLLGLLQLRNEFATARQVAPEEGGTEAEAQGTGAVGSVKGRFLALVCWLVAFVLAIHVFGFLVAIFLFLLVFLKGHQTSWLKAVLVAGVSTGIIYGLFEAFLERELWRGWWGIF